MHRVIGLNKCDITCCIVILELFKGGFYLFIFLESLGLLQCTRINLVAIFLSDPGMKVLSTKLTLFLELVSFLRVGGYFYPIS